MVGINHIGENVIDLECIVSDMNGAEIKCISSGSEVEALVFPESNSELEIVVYDPSVNKYYGGRINPDSEKVVSGNSLIVDNKFDQLGGLTEITKEQYGASKGLKLEVTERSPGGGAINCGVGVQVFLNALEKPDIVNRLVVPNGDGYIEKFLLDNYELSEYSPQGWNKSAGLNINFKLDGKKFILRSPYEWPYENGDGYKIDFVQEGDIVIINTIKHAGYIDGLLDSMGKDQTTGILIATDSSMKSMGIDKVRELVQYCSVIVSNDSELDKLANGETRELGKQTSGLLVEAMKKIYCENQIIYTTLGDKGIALYDGQYVYKQDISIAPFQVKNTSGCGDGTAALIVLGTVVNYDPLSVLIDANIAGQINSENLTASSNDMATKERIRQFKEAYQLKPIEVYRASEGKFVSLNGGT